METWIFHTWHGYSRILLCKWRIDFEGNHYKAETINTLEFGTTNCNNDFDVRHVVEKHQWLQIYFKRVPYVIRQLMISKELVRWYIDPDCNRDPLSTIQVSPGNKKILHLPSWIVPETTSRNLTWIVPPLLGRLHSKLHSRAHGVFGSACCPINRTRNDDLEILDYEQPATATNDFSWWRNRTSRAWHMESSCSRRNERSGVAGRELAHFETGNRHTPYWAGTPQAEGPMLHILYRIIDGCWVQLTICTCHGNAKKHIFVQFRLSTADFASSASVGTCHEGARPTPYEIKCFSQ